MPSPSKALMNSQRRVRFIVAAITCIFISTCAKEQLNAPMCRMSEESASAPASAAACIIRLDNKLVTIASFDSGWRLPTGQFQINQPAQCTAHRAVWQTTGLNVEVSQKLGETSNHIQIYNCILAAGFDSQTQEIPIPPWAQYNVDKIGIINPYETTLNQWSGDIDAIQIRRLFNQIH